MLALPILIAISTHAGAEWTPVHEDPEATTSISARPADRAGGHLSVAVRTMFKDDQSGGFIHQLEVDCGANRLRAVHEAILDPSGETVTEGPSISADWTTPPEEAPFSAVMRRVCVQAD